MKTFDQLTQHGKARRLRKIAFEALSYYEFNIKSVSLITVATNTLFKVRTENGEKFALRISSPGEATMADHEVELFWLNALASDTNLNVVHPVPRRDGLFISFVTHPEIPETRRCILFRWIPGRPIKHSLTSNNYFKLGVLMAKLHNHASTLNPLPAQLQPKRWDKVFYYADEPVVYNTAPFTCHFSPNRISIINQIVERGNALLCELYENKTDRILIHADLHYWNVHRYRNKLFALDFEDVMHGYPIQDIAITLSYGRNIDGHIERAKSFKEGYIQQRPWPVTSLEQQETLIAARRVMFVNYAARILNDPTDYLDDMFVKLEDYLRTNSF